MQTFQGHQPMGQKDQHECTCSVCPELAMVLKVDFSFWSSYVVDSASKSGCD